MNYRHIYHAGNFADVIKHVLLITVLRTLQKKETPFGVLDTHAGIGLYPLYSVETQRSAEYKNGIELLFSNRNEIIPIEIQEYLSIVQHHNSLNKLDYYPGSPLIAAHYLRSQDRLIVCELQAEDFQTLKRKMYAVKKEKNIALHYMDAYAALKAFIPLNENRGLVLIDPPFEAIDEFKKLIGALKIALKHWRSGHFMIWYPIKNKRLVESFYQSLEITQTPKLIVEFAISNIFGEKLHSCGIVLLNPPWKTKEILCTSILPYLADKLNATWKIQS